MFTRHRPWVTGASLAIVTVLGRRRRRAAPSDEPAARSAARARRQHHAGLRRLVQNRDGSFSMLIGYYNRNSKEPLDIPVGPNNRIEPGDPDQGQPTHFEIGRQWGVFVDQGAEGLRQRRSITWTIVVERRDAVGAVHAEQGLSDHVRSRNSAWATSRRRSRFHEGGAEGHGPADGRRRQLDRHGRTSRSRSASGSRIRRRQGGRSADAVAAHGSVATVSFHKFRGPGNVTFDKRAHSGAASRASMVTRDGDVQRARRIPAARAGQRRIG